MTQNYHFPWKAKRIHKVETQRSKGLRMKKSDCCPGVQCVSVKNPNSSNSRKPIEFWAN